MGVDGRRHLHGRGHREEGKGTDVILHLREDEKQYLDEWEIRDVVQRYSDFIEHPVVMEVEKEKQSELDKSKTVKLKEDETLNSRKAVWLRDKSEITHEEYNQFYKHVSHDTEDPLKVIHYKAEGTSEFTGLLYIPSKPPFNIFWKEYKIGPMLYVKRVRIMEHCEDAAAAVSAVRQGRRRFFGPPPQHIAGDAAEQQAGRDHQEQHREEGARHAGRYQEGRAGEVPLFYRQFGAVLKEGLYYDFARKEAIADLLLFASTKAEKDEFEDASGIRGRHEGRPGVHLLHACDVLGGGGQIALPGGLPRQGLRGAHHARRGGRPRHERASRIRRSR